MVRESSIAIATIALVLSACSMVEKRDWAHDQAMAEQAARQALVASQQAMAASKQYLADRADSVVASGKSAAQRMASYVQRRQLLEKFTEAGDYGEDAIVYLRRRSSIGGFTSGGRLPKFKTFDMPDLPKEYAGEYRWPVEAGVISSEYGKRFGKLHKGIDVAADIGEPIRAIADGYVVYSGNKIAGYGNIIVLRHDESTLTLYAHNSRNKAKTGEHVAQGQVIALLGNSGRSTGPHSHFETRRLDVAVNPREFLGKGPLDEAPLRGELDPLREFLVAWRD